MTQDSFTKRILRIATMFLTAIYPFLLVWLYIRHYILWMIVATVIFIGAFIIPQILKFGQYCKAKDKISEDEKNAASTQKSIFKIAKEKLDTFSLFSFMLSKRISIILASIGLFWWILYAFSKLFLSELSDSIAIEAIARFSVWANFIISFFILGEYGCKITAINEYFFKDNSVAKNRRKGIVKSNLVGIFHTTDIVFVCIIILNLWQILFDGPDNTIYLWLISHLSNFNPIKDVLFCPLDNFSILLAFHFIADPTNRKRFIKSFLYGRLNTALIFIGSLTAVALVIATNYNREWKVNHLIFLDAIFSAVFLIELGMRIHEEGIGYFLTNSINASGKRRPDLWNLFDSVIIIVSTSSFFMLHNDFGEASGLTAIICFRLIRILKLFRIIKKYQKDLGHLLVGIGSAISKSMPIFAIFIISLTLLGFLLSYFSQKLGIGNAYFANPVSSIVSLFQLFTYDGWHYIPEDISEECKSLWPSIWWVDGAIRMGFCVLVGAGGIVGVALLNSVFVDGMLGRDKSDDERRKKLQELSEKMDLLSQKLDSIDSNRDIKMQ